MTFFGEAYIFDIIGGDDSVYRYRFVSEGEHNITKVISVREIRGLDGFYNLGFGNLEFRKDGTEFVNDQSTINNNDFDKVLKTVFGCMAHYLQVINPSARVLFFGNTEHKHKTYRRMIGNYITELSEYLIVEGGSLNGTVPFVEQKEKVIRKGKESERTIKMKDPEAILALLAEAKLEFIEPFDRTKSGTYQFISIRLKS